MQKLELTWIGKNEELRVEPRILLHDESKDYGDSNSENMLIHGDNLLALKALEQEYAGKVKCVYIDPPYNTGSAFEHYDDNLEHSIWLNLMVPRLEILKRLLCKEGIIWISLDDNEAHYLKVISDEIFGRKNFIADVAWEKSDSPRMDAKLFSSRYDHTLVYAKNIEHVKINQVKTTEIPAHYNKVADDGRKYYLKPLRYMGAADARADRPNLYYAMTAPDGEKIYPKRTDGSDGRWRWASDTVDENKDLIEWINGRNGWSVYYRIYADTEATRPPETLFHFQEAGSNRIAKSEIKTLFNDIRAFDTPKPEKLIKLILEISSCEGELVLDSFCGSGTTIAVAHKMNRKYIGIELGEQAYTLCKVRLDLVINGEQGGVSQAVNWHGGGGYKFYELAPTLIKIDSHGMPVFSEEYNSEMLVTAVSKANGYNYAPDKETFWKQGRGQDNSFIYVTTQYLTAEMLDDIAKEVSSFEKLLICALAFDVGLNKRYDNILVKKIPQTLLKKCEYGVDNYNLNIVNPPEIDDDEWRED